MRRMCNLLFLAIAVSAIGCGDDRGLNASARPIRLGEYIGTYTIIRNFEGVTDSSKTCDTEFTLDETSYSINEMSYVCPPRSYGTYELTATTIAFRDTAIHTEEFDWSLIPRGVYDYTFDGVNLHMSQFDTVQASGLEYRQYVYELALKD